MVEQVSCLQCIQLFMSGFLSQSSVWLILSFCRQGPTVTDKVKTACV